MPKSALSSLPVSGLFAIAKPSGLICMPMLDALKPLVAESRLFVDAKTIAEQKNAYKRSKGKPKNRFYRNKGVKIGQGGTLDPLADGVLVVGIGAATKKLQAFLDGPKEYRTTALLGCETDTYDSQGTVVRTAPWSHVTREKVESVLDRFRGEITQLPPIYSALKMDGKPLYEYAREGKPLPRPIDPRKVTVHSIECIGWEDGAPFEGDDASAGHRFNWPSKRSTEEERRAMDAVRNLVVQSQAGELEAEAAQLPEAAIEDNRRPPIFQLRMSVSGGTYVRTLVHDIGHALGSAAHVVTLTRTQQGEFSLEGGDCVDWGVFERATARRVGGGGEGEVERDAEGWEEWEAAVREKLVVVEDVK